MSTHHATTALRYLEDVPRGAVYDEGIHSLVYAQLEIAAQIERMADGAEAIAEGIRDFARFAESFLTNLPLNAIFSVVKQFDPNQNND